MRRQGGRHRSFRAAGRPTGRASGRNGLDLLLHSRREGRSSEAVYAELCDGKVDGIVLFAPPDDPLVALLAATGLTCYCTAGVKVGRLKRCMLNYATARWTASFFSRRRTTHW